MSQSGGGGGVAQRGGGELKFVTNIAEHCGLLSTTGAFS